MMRSVESPIAKPPPRPVACAVSRAPVRDGVARSTEPTEVPRIRTSTSSIVQVVLEYAGGRDFKRPWRKRETSASWQAPISSCRFGRSPQS